MAYLIPGWLLTLEGGNVDGAVTRFGSPLGVVARQGFGLFKTTVHGTCASALVGCDYLIWLTHYGGWINRVSPTSEIGHAT